MPPSTVFSYWRRDHRRTSPAPPGSVSPAGYSPTGSSTYNANAAPRLPDLPPSKTTSNDLYRDGQEVVDHDGQLQPSKDLLYAESEKRHSNALSSQHSFNNLRVPSSSSPDNLKRPHSSPGNTAESSLSPESTQSQVLGVPQAAGHHQNDIQIQAQPQSQRQPQPKSMNNGSWRSGFNRNGTNTHAEDHRKPAGKDLRINTNVGGELGFIGGVTLKEMRTEGLLSGRDNHEQQQQHLPQGMAPSQTQHDHASQPKHGKTKRHLLNPMSLLVRRRSSQFAGSRADEGNLGIHNLVPAIPDDYDPRIRGNIVHDFSAPRPRPQIAGKDGSNESVKKTSVPSSATTRHSQHSPVFKEHFDEDGKVLQIENKGYLQSSLLTNPGSANHDIAELPEFARRLPSSLPTEHTINHCDEQQQQQQSPQVEDQKNRDEEHESFISQPSIQPTPRSSPRKSMEATLNQVPSSSVPMRLKSDASRFSFDMNGVGSSVQEKLLEEKHKEKEAARREKALQERSNFSDYEDDDFDYDVMEDDGGFEEQIPGINADPDDSYEDEFQGFSGVVKTLAEQSTFVPVLPTIAASPVAPAYSGPVLLAAAVEGVSIEQAVALDSYTMQGEYEVLRETHDGRENAVEQLINTKTHGSQSLPLIAEDEDDMYFDDGEFGDLDENEHSDKFDESIFDDDNSHLYERKFYPGTKIPVTLQEEDEQLEQVETSESHMRHMPSLASNFRPESWDIRNGLPPARRTGDDTEDNSTGVPGGILSEHNLEAFHSALARVADEAAANHLRDLSLSELSLDQENMLRPGEASSGKILDTKNGKGNQLSDMINEDEIAEAIDDFNFDDDDEFDDDLIIAEANAEALENDDEGFYGQEFGFYARSNNDNCSDQPIYGGYFGASGTGGLHRSHSGGANFREPSLTPITERSEWSTRNSIISLSTLGAAAVSQQQQQQQVPNALSNPGLSQLVDLEYNEEDMTLGALMKLRRGAFGGSNGSLRSSGSLSPQPGPVGVGASNRGSFLSIPEDSPVDLTSDIGFQSPQQLQHPLYETDGGLYQYNSTGHLHQSPLSDSQILPVSPTLTRATN